MGRSKCLPLVAGKNLSWRTQGQVVGAGGPMALWSWAPRHMGCQVCMQSGSAAGVHVSPGSASTLPLQEMAPDCA